MIPPNQFHAKRAAVAADAPALPPLRRLAPSIESRAKTICQLRIHLASMYILGYLIENVNKGHKALIFGPPLMDVW